jgi:hypothetical protein
MAVEERKIAIATRKARDPEASRPELVDSASFTWSSIFPESPGLLGSMWHHLLCPTRASAPASVISANRLLSISCEPPMLRPDLERLLGSRGAGQAVCAARREIRPVSQSLGDRHTAY